MNKMNQIVIGFILLAPAALAQIDEIRPDISYAGNSDRFDLSGMLSAQNKMLRNTPLGDDHEDEVVAADDYRRLLHNENAEILLDTLTKKHPNHALPTRRGDDVVVNGNKFAEDDSMNSFEGGTVSDFEDNLKHFDVNNIKLSGRRKLNDELAVHEILLQNVFPIVMKIDGYLKPPL